MIEKLGIFYINPVKEFVQDGYYNDHYQKALKFRETLVKDKIDILLTGGVFPIIDFLYLSRVAPLQIYYSHGNCAFDIEGIDKRVSHFAQECQEFEWNILNVPISKEFLVGDPGEKVIGEIIKSDYKKRFGEDLVILGTIGRLIKVNSDEYIETISKIMEENPNTIYLACGIGNESDIQEKLEKYGVDQERFFFLGQVKPHVYGWVIDLYLSPFPLGGGQALDEYRAKIKSYVAMHDVRWYEKYKRDFCNKPQNYVDATLYKEEILQSLYKCEKPLLPENKYIYNYAATRHVLDKEDYLKMALRLIRDKDLEAKTLQEYQYTISKRTLNISHFLRLFND
jgi:glycosyltransferase involved in cell wall biosynthesis